MILEFGKDSANFMYLQLGWALRLYAAGSHAQLCLVGNEVGYKAGRVSLVPLAFMLFLPPWIAWPFPGDFVHDGWIPRE